MRHDLHAIVLTATAALTLLAASAPAFAAIVDCSSIQSIDNRESWKANNADLKQCINRGWPVPPGWVPNGGKGAGITAGGAGGFSYGTVRAPESPPGSRNEAASVSSAAITSSCNFPPRITVGYPPTITFSAGSCLDFMSNLFKDKTGGSTTTVPPIGVSASDTCPADSNNSNLYGQKVTATGTVPAPCGATVPTATADLGLAANATELATATNGSYLLWTYRKAGANFAARLTAVALPTYFCGAYDGDGLPIKTVDLTPPTEQMITYKVTDGYIAIRLQSRATMPSTFIPPYVATDPEMYLVLPLDGAGDPIVPPNCADPAPYYKPTYGKQDYLIQSALVGSSICSSLTPTMVNYPQCSDGSQPSCDPFVSPPHSVWFPTCNPANPPVAWSARVAPDASGHCPADVSDPTCTPSGLSMDANCDVVTIPITATSSCPNQVQYMALNRPTLYYPPATSATFSTISGRTQLMAQAVNGSRWYMQQNTIVTIMPSAPPTTLMEGGIITQQDGKKLIMSAGAKVSGSGAVSLTNGGSLVTAGGTLITTFAAGASYALPGGAPYTVNVNRSMNLTPAYQVPTVPTTGPQPPYVQLPLTDVGP